MVYDLIVIGGGPAGYLACERAGHAGFNTLLIEKRNIGGVCLNEGCVPTKTLLYSAKLKDGAAHGEKYGVIAKDIQIDHPTVLKRKQKVVSKLVGGVKIALKAAGVYTISSEGKVTGKSAQGYTVLADGKTYEGKRLLIASGSVPVVPPIPGLDAGLKSGLVATNREILELQTVPKEFVVIGGGVIGLEMASYFCSVGSNVTVIEMLDHIGGATDKDIEKILKKNYEKKGVRFELGAKVVKIGESTVEYEQNGEAKSVGADQVLLSIGRRAFTQNLGLETIGVETERGAIKTDEKMKTNMPEVYAAGDVTGKSMLAHTAYREAEVAVNNMLGKRDIMRYSAIPGVIYTNPEVASVGETEATAKAKGLNVTVKTVSMQYSGRYVAENEGGNGIVKIVVDNDWNKIIGVQIVGNYASEIIFGAGIMIEKEMTIDEIKQLVFPHPTVSEILREAVFQL